MGANGFFLAIAIWTQRPMIAGAIFDNRRFAFRDSTGPQGKQTWEAPASDAARWSGRDGARVTIGRE